MHEQNLDEFDSDYEETLFSLTPEAQASIRKIFGYQSILRRILENISSSKLFQFRLVNKLWEEETTSVILDSRDSTPQLDFCYDWKEKYYKVWKFGKARERNEKPKSLSKLNECISSSRRFPCSNFRICNTLNLETGLLPQFLELHGKEIKTLKILHEDIFLLRKILFEEARNIQNLKLEHFARGSENGGKLMLFSEKTEVFLPHLESLHVVGYSPQASDVILAAPNLKKIHGDVFQTVDALSCMGKLDLIKSLRVSPDFSQFPKYLEKWADQKGAVKLESLELRIEFWAGDLWTLNMENSLSRFLDGNRESLRKISVCLHEKFFSGAVIWPKFENVEDLSVSSLDLLIGVQPFSPNFISNVFPNITKLKEKTHRPEDGREFGCEFVDHVQLSFLVTDSPLLRLKVVEIESGYPEWFDALARAAPNVEQLVLTGSTCIFTSIGFISRLLKLKTLCLGSKQHGPLLVTDKFPQLEMAMTGLSEEIVRKLQENPIYFAEMKSGGKGQDMITRVTPSILDCPALEVLVSNFAYVEDREDNQTLFTPVSQEFGFKLMSQVQWTHSTTYFGKDMYH